MSEHKHDLRYPGNDPENGPARCVNCHYCADCERRIASCKDGVQLVEAGQYERGLVCQPCEIDAQRTGGAR